MQLLHAGVIRRNIISQLSRGCIGPEVIDEAVKVLQAVGTRYGHSFQYTLLKGAVAYRRLCGQCLPEETGQCCLARAMQCRSARSADRSGTACGRAAGTALLGTSSQRTRSVCRISDLPSCSMRFRTLVRSNRRRWRAVWICWWSEN